jgi:CheY-like chemotaxis protein
LLIFAAGSLAGARKIAGNEKIDFVISDIGLPDGNGNDLMKDLGERYGLKGIALTGYGMEQDVERSLAAGFVTHLTKPVRVQSLEKILSPRFNCSMALEHLNGVRFQLPDK